MVDGALVKVEELIRLGQQFTYENFAAKSHHG